MTSSMLSPHTMDMTLEIDKFGRILLPKKVREQMQLKTGEKIRLHLEGDTVTLKPPTQTAELVERGRRLVITNLVIEGDPIREIYEQRAKELW
jgi:AbrB family looped-hinge helix DNA binding protein